MKRKKEMTEIEAAEEPAEVEPKKPDTQPLSETVKFIKCVYNGTVRVNCPSGQSYRFEPGQVLPVREPADYHHLLALKRNPGPGCCSGSPAQVRYYFEAVEFTQEV